MTITKITATKLYKRSGAFKGYRYDAIFEDGSVKVARASATRLYLNAYRYDAPVNGSGKSGLAPYFCFGKQAPRVFFANSGLSPVQTFLVELVDD